MPSAAAAGRRPGRALARPRSRRAARRSPCVPPAIADGAEAAWMRAASAPFPTQLGVVEAQRDASVAVAQHDAEVAATTPFVTLPTSPGLQPHALHYRERPSVLP